MLKEKIKITIEIDDDKLSQAIDKLIDVMGIIEKEKGK